MPSDKQLRDAEMARANVVRNMLRDESIDEVRTEIAGYSEDMIIAENAHRALNGLPITEEAHRAIARRLLDLHRLVISEMDARNTADADNKEMRLLLARALPFVLAFEWDPAAASGEQPPEVLRDAKGLAAKISEVIA